MACGESTVIIILCLTFITLMEEETLYVHFLGFLLTNNVQVQWWRSDQVLVLGLACQQLVLLLQALPDQEYLGHGASCYHLSLHDSVELTNVRLHLRQEWWLADYWDQRAEYVRASNGHLTPAVAASSHLWLHCTALHCTIQYMICTNCSSSFGVPIFCIFSILFNFLFLWVIP